MIYRQEKGAPLTAEDLDQNFRELLERIEILEQNPEPAEGIGEMTLEGNKLLIKGTFGHLYGRFPLPRSESSFKGAWSPENAYQKDDWVSHEGRLLRALVDHQDPKMRDDLWEVIFEHTAKTVPPLRLQLYPFELLPEGVVGDMALAIQKESREAKPVYHNGTEWLFFQNQEESL